jgi:hypothetical protein
MSTKIEIQPDVARKLSAIAKMHGVLIDTFALSKFSSG